MLCRLMIDLYAPTAANSVEPTGANWQAVPLEWLLRAAGYSPSTTIGALYERYDALRLSASTPVERQYCITLPTRAKYGTANYAVPCPARRLINLN